MRRGGPLLVLTNIRKVSALRHEEGMRNNNNIQDLKTLMRFHHIDYNQATRPHAFPGHLRCGFTKTPTSGENRKSAIELKVSEIREALKDRTERKRTKRSANEQ